jgi:hypothetical protein
MPGATLKAFWFGALGTVLGTLVAFKAVGSLLGPGGWKVKVLEISVLKFCWGETFQDGGCSMWLNLFLCLGA